MKDLSDMMGAKIAFFFFMCTQMNQKFRSDNVFQHTTPSQWHMPGWGGELQAFTALTGRTPSAWQYQESYFLTSTLKTVGAERSVCGEIFYVYTHLLFMYNKRFVWFNKKKNQYLRYLFCYWSWTHVLTSSKSVFFFPGSLAFSYARELP